MLSEFLLTQLHPSLGQDSASAKTSKTPHLALYRQLVEALRKALRQGRLSAGDRLPSSRDLAHDLSLSRNTVVAAINQLVTEGYLCSVVGSGTFVSEALNLPKGQGNSPHRTASIHCAELSERGKTLSQRFLAKELEVQPFPPGVADFSAFLTAQWQRLQNKHWRMSYPDMLDYSVSGGFAPLKRVMTQYLRTSRGVQLDSSQILITTGTQQSIALCAQLLADSGDTVWMEDPAYWGAIKAFTASGLTLQAIAVDNQGLAPHLSNQSPHNKQPKLIYLTPSHQYPTGSVMSLARRQELLDQAASAGAWILEDDYDSEFRFSGPPISSLQGMDTHGCVLYMGTFSKIMYPGLKIGYLVVPKPLVEAFQNAHYDLNRPGQLPLQAALSEFIETGHFATSIRKARKGYSERRQCLLQALEPILNHEIHISGADQGLHLCVHLPSYVDDIALKQAIARQGMTVRALSQYCLQRRDLKGLIIGYGYATLPDIAHYGPILAQTVSQHMKTHHRNHKI